MSAQATLPNGLRVFLAEDHELPLVRGTLLMRGGQRAAPPSAVGMLHCPLVQAYYHLSAFCLRHAALAEQAAHAAALDSSYVSTLLHRHRVTPMCSGGRMVAGSTQCDAPAGLSLSCMSIEVFPQTCAGVASLSPAVQRAGGSIDQPHLWP